MRLWYAISEFILVIIICINFLSLDCFCFPVKSATNLIWEVPCNLQTIYKFYKEVVNIKSKTRINDCGEEMQKHYWSWLLCTSFYRRRKSSEFSMCSFPSLSSALEFVCDHQQVSAMKSLIANGFVFVVIVIQPCLITCNSNRIEKKILIWYNLETDHNRFSTLEPSSPSWNTSTTKKNICHET